MRSDFQKVDENFFAQLYRVCDGIVPVNFENEKNKIIEYVRNKWPEAQPEEIYGLNNNIMSYMFAIRDENTCSNCSGHDCQISGHMPLGIFCREKEDGEFLYFYATHNCPKITPISKKQNAFDMFMAKSGLSKKQQNQTFKEYYSKGLSPEISNAKAQAMLAASEGSWLVLAGQKGTGKSHLAVSIALEVMRSGYQAYFKLVSEMLDDLRAGYKDDTYNEKMNDLKTVHCLILDDLGKERTTTAGIEFLYQIIDARYRSQKQTIMTTNARSREELASWGNPDYLAPIISRFDEMGQWVSILKSDDIRARLNKKIK